MVETKAIFSIPTIGFSNDPIVTETCASANMLPISIAMYWYNPNNVVKYEPYYVNIWPWMKDDMKKICRLYAYDKHEVKKQMIPKRLCPWSLIEITPPHISGQAPAPLPPPFPSSNFPHLKCLSASSSRFRVRVTPCLLLTMSHPWGFQLPWHSCANKSTL